jgi:hypothetical protein
MVKFPNHYYVNVVKLLGEMLDGKITAPKVTRTEYSICVDGNFKIEKRKFIFELYMSWKVDGTEGKPVTTLRIGDHRISFGRFAFWDDFRSVSEDLYCQRVIDAVERALEEAF